MSITQKDAGTKHRCPHCDYTSPTGAGLAAHIRHNHPDDWTPKKPSRASKAKARKKKNATTAHGVLGAIMAQLDTNAVQVEFDLLVKFCPCCGTDIASVQAMMEARIGQAVMDELADQLFHAASDPASTSISVEQLLARVKRAAAPSGAQSATHLNIGSSED